MELIQRCIILFVLLSNVQDVVASFRASCPDIKAPNLRTRLRSKGRIVNFRCNKKFERVGVKFAVCLDSGHWSQQIPTCVGTTCRKPDPVPNMMVEELYKGGVLKFTCGAGLIRTGPETLMCDGIKWNDQPPKCIEGTTLQCDFEDTALCGWSQDFDDDFDWTWQNGETPTAQTGPRFDHTTNTSEGHYLYMESSAPQAAGQKTRLLSPPYVPDNMINMCLEFFYHMYGPDGDGEVGELDVYIKPLALKPILLDLSQRIFHQKGNQGDQWLSAIVQLPLMTETFQIVIEATRLRSWSADIAIDDVKLQNCVEESTTLSGPVDGDDADDEDNIQEPVIQKTDKRPIITTAKTTTDSRSTASTPSTTKITVGATSESTTTRKSTSTVTATTGTQSTKFVTTPSTVTTVRTTPTSSSTSSTPTTAKTTNHPSTVFRSTTTSSTSTSTTTSTRPTTTTVKVTTPTTVTSTTTSTTFTTTIRDTTTPVTTIGISSAATTRTTTSKSTSEPATSVFPRHTSTDKDDSLSTAEASSTIGNTDMNDLSTPKGHGTTTGTKDTNDDNGSDDNNADVYDYENETPTTPNDNEQAGEKDTDFDVTTKSTSSSSDYKDYDSIPDNLGPNSTFNTFEVHNDSQPSANHNIDSNKGTKSSSADSGKSLNNSDPGHRAVRAKDGSASNTTEVLPLIIGVASAVVVAAIVIAVLAYLWARNQRRKQEKEQEDQMNIITEYVETNLST